MLRDTWVLVELDELECRWRRRWPRLAMDRCMVAICWPKSHMLLWRSSNWSSSLCSTRSNRCLMPCCILQCCPLVMDSSSPSKMGSSSSLEVAICAREPLPLIITGHDQVKGKTVQIQGWSDTTLTYHGWSVWMSDSTQGTTEKAHTGKSTRKRLGKWIGMSCVKLQNKSNPRKWIVKSV